MEIGRLGICEIQVALHDATVLDSSQQTSGQPF